MGARKRAQKAEAKRREARKRAAVRRAAGVEKSSTQERTKPSEAGGTVTPQDVNLGHVMALRPRVDATFRPDDFVAAQARLEDKTYDTIEEAARAVAETALELTRDPVLTMQRLKR